MLRYDNMLTYGIAHAAYISDAFLSRERNRRSTLLLFARLLDQEPCVRIVILRKVHDCIARDSKLHVNTITTLKETSVSAAL